MAALEDLIQEIPDENLRQRIQIEVANLKQTKKFGLVFENQKPECVPLYTVPVKKNSLVALKAGKINETYRVLAVDGHKVFCSRDNKIFSFDLNEVISVAQFGDPIYPSLQLIDTVCNAPDSSLWHTLIEADNYHALQLLKYCYAGKVDCIYIDPPYNTGARDWKYNNEYVDGNDTYRHSKWLSMMQARLELAKEILNPADSVLIVTADEHEYLHLGCLLEEIFRGSQIQMVSSVINPAGVSRNSMFARTNEYVFFVMIGEARPTTLKLGDEWIGDIKNKARKEGLRWNTLLRSGTNFLRTDRPNLFYPIFVSNDGKKINSVGESYYGTNRNEVIAPEGTVAIFPIRSTGEEGNWRVSREKFVELLGKGYVRLGRFNDRGTIAIDYIAQGEAKKIEDGTFKILGRNENGTVIVDDSDYKPTFIPGCQWNIPNHDSTQKGTKLLNAIIGNRFSFPKSLYAVRDCLKFFVANKPNALIVDFFAGSGTTLHAVNLLNAEDGGKRRCILVTNNEVSDAEEKTFRKQGLTPADDDWQKFGIARYVTWPRTVCSIEGHDINGDPLKGNYLDSDLAMADGFNANAAFFKLGFLDKDFVALGRQFKEILPVIWFKAGCRGKCPTLADEKNLPPMLILPENYFAVLIDEFFFGEFESKLRDLPNIDTLFFVTDSDYGYHAMIRNFHGKTTYQLYQNYLENFKISG